MAPREPRRQPHSSIGIALGLGMLAGVTLWMSWPTKVSREAVAVAFVFAAVTGVFFGFYPARKAAARNASLMPAVANATTASAKHPPASAFEYGIFIVAPSANAAACSGSSAC